MCLAVDHSRRAGQGRAMDGVPLDALVTRMLARSPFDYRVAGDDSECEIAYRLRGGTVLDRGWCTADDLPGGMERDKYDDHPMTWIAWSSYLSRSMPPGRSSAVHHPRSRTVPPRSR